MHCPRDWVGIELVHWPENMSKGCSSQLGILEEPSEILCSCEDILVCMCLRCANLQVILTVLMIDSNLTEEILPGRSTSLHISFTARKSPVLENSFIRGMFKQLRMAVEHAIQDSRLSDISVSGPPGTCH
jgi:hypothetical protein